MANKGYEVISPREERYNVPEEEWRAMRSGGTRYLTFVSPDGNVRIDVTVNSLYYHENSGRFRSVYMADEMSASIEGWVTIKANVTY